MALHDDNKAAGAEKATAEGARQQQTNQQQSKGFSPAMNLRKGGLFASPLGSTMGSEYLNNLKELVIDVMKQAVNEEFEFNLIYIDRENQTGFHYSFLIMTARHRTMRDLGVAYHTLILEETGLVPEPVIEMINGNRVEVQRYASNAMDERMAKIIENLVRSQFPDAKVLLPTDATVVPRGFDPKDKDAVFNLCHNTALALGTEISTASPDFHDFHISDAASDGGLAINIGFQSATLADPVGSPMRSDILLNFSSQPERRQGQGADRYSLHAEEETKKVSEVCGFLDLLYAPAQGPVGGMFNPYQQQPQNIPTQMYAARMVITNLASNFSYTPAAVLLGIYASLALQENNNWIQYFRGTHTDGVDYKDIGALNVEASLEDMSIRQDPNRFGKRFDTKAESFTLANLGQLISALIHPGLIVSLDVPRSGPQSWYLGVFAAASVGNNNAARQAIINAANVLTGGVFSRYFDNTKPMFDDVNNPIHLGHYTDREGRQRDIRDIDYLAVANMVADTNPAAIRDWSDTFVGQYPLLQRLAGRQQMITELTKGRAVFTGMADRVTFSSNFLSALARGIQESGVAININTPMSIAAFTDQRASATFITNSMLDPNMHAFNQRASSAPGGNFQWGGGFGGGRWGTY